MIFFKNSFKIFLTNYVRGFKLFSESISSIINFVLLSLVYVIGVGVTSFFSKLLKKSFIKKSQNKKISSYWKNFSLKEDEKTQESSYRMW
jgi:broad specificity polyphosphatase/5'/3'-nucleotidase SurE